MWNSTGGLRSDGRCGRDFPLDDYTPAACDPTSADYCCSGSGWCGHTDAHCNCDKCVNYKPTKNTTGKTLVKLFIFKYQNLPHACTDGDQIITTGRCGPGFPLADGSPTTCDPDSADFCCSPGGWCGHSWEHCSCDGCVNYRPDSEDDIPPPVTVKPYVRPDNRCGPEFPLDGKPGRCDPEAYGHCCSEYGYCGNEFAHCNCDKCVNFCPGCPSKPFNITDRVRSDNKCGPRWELLDDGKPSECNPKNDFYCCSKAGYCDKTEEACNCPECVNYRDRN